MRELIEVEKSIIKKYRKDIWRKFVQGVDEFEMIKDGDKIAVCISGGKDSFLLAKCMQELKKHGKIKFDLEFIVMNPGYNQENMDLIMSNSKDLNIKVKVFESSIFEYVTSLKEGSPCYLCARMRRGFLYSKAKELGCNKIALGHHFDDVIETILLSMLYGAEIKTMMPKLHSDNYENMELIRPLYLVKEQYIISWKNSNEIRFLNCACKFTMESADKVGLSKRKEMKELIGHFRKVSPYIEQNIYKSVYNVNLNTVIGYHKDGTEHHFLDEYDK